MKETICYFFKISARQFQRLSNKLNFSLYLRKSELIPIKIETLPNISEIHNKRRTL